MSRIPNFLMFLMMYIGIGCVIPLYADASMADNKMDDAAVQDWTVDVVRRRLSEAATALKAARRATNPETAIQLDLTLDQLEARVRKWLEVETAYNGLITEMQRHEELRKEADTIAEEINAFQQRGLLKKPPYTLSYYDDRLVAYVSLQQRMETADLALKAAQRSEEESRVRLRNALDQLQRLKTSMPAAENSKELWTRQGYQLDVQLADALRRLNTLRVQNIRQEKQIYTDQAGLLDKQANVVRLGLAYDEKDLEEQNRALEQKKSKLKLDLKLLHTKKKESDQQWLKTQDRTRKSVYTDKLTRLEDRLKGINQWRKTYQEAIDQHEEMLRLIDHQQTVWQQRYALLKQVPGRAELLQWYEQSQQRLANINRVLTIEQQRQNSLWQQTGSLEEGAKGLDQTPKRGANGAFLMALRQLAIYRLDYISTLVSGRGLEERLSQEIDAHLEHKPLTYQAEKLWSQLRGVWTYQVWVIDDRPLTVQKIVVALVILLAGIVTTKIVIHRVAKRILARPQIKATTAATIEKLLLYLGYMLVVLFTLRMVSIPLAAFAFLGGAIAIGLGFGAQNLINNFISGFIIMGEQPINIGDLIEVEGVLGQVEEIGARCTRIRTGENIHILVPNSSFLEKNITNWTLSDKMIRAHVTVGVAYGSSIDQVEKLLLEACGEFDLIRKNPEPFVLFTDFGDNALVFKVHFWINVSQVIERRLIESRLRFRIDELFRLANIVIAFPQRDVHLDSSQPLKVQMLDNGVDSKPKQPK